MSVAAAQEVIGTGMDNELLASNKTVEYTKTVLTRRREAVRRMQDEMVRSKSRSRSPKSRSPSPGSGRCRAPPSSPTGPDSYVRTARFAILCSERNVFKARVEKELADETVVARGLCLAAPSELGN
jgi:hypothetical protein